MTSQDTHTHQYVIYFLLFSRVTCRPSVVLLTTVNIVWECQTCLSFSPYRPNIYDVARTAPSEVPTLKDV